MALGSGEWVDPLPPEASLEQVEQDMLKSELSNLGLIVKLGTPRCSLLQESFWTSPLRMRLATKTQGFSSKALSGVCLALCLASSRLFIFASMLPDRGLTHPELRILQVFSS